MISASCHCGAVRIEIPAAPATATACNCSICRRLGALWAFYPLDAVRVTAAPEATKGYVWGKGSRRFVHCRTCACTTHVEPVSRQRESEIEVNLKMFEPTLVEGVRIRRFDGADSWKYLDA